MRARDVVITGLGTAVAGAGGPETLLRGPVAGGDDPVTRLRGPGLRYKDRATRLALCAARDALADAGLPEALDAPEGTEGGGGPLVDGLRFGVVVSTNWGNVDTVCETSATIHRAGYTATSPMLLPNTASNVTASWVAITHGLRGANVTLCNGPTSGLDAVHWARTLIAAGRLDHALVIGVEPVNEPVRRLVGTGGPGLFDGAVSLVAEAAPAAAARGARPLARVGPYARRADPDAAVAAVRADEPAAPARWYVPEGRPAGGDTGPAGLPAHDLSLRWGRSSGALGVLQCVAGTAELARTGQAAALASAGGEGDDGAAALLLLAATAAGAGA
ncbi:beta-ketoacyl synthase N-terminal-like domain-containing protein [Streptomyces sp.]|uniref:beta-ketoacyl synthase N-terminal-like domain-containing protein n=1 Tax=Streptomyces sp. TaxID=1931 RepID=UPI0028110C7F|nr:beta-ketoacyl synthase N-terminal-like domain-containing protein [Streptomyces sp.]